MSEQKCENSVKSGALEERDGEPGGNSVWIGIEQQSRIVDIKRARRIPSEQKCKIIDADKRVMKKLRVKKLSINKQPGLCVKPSLDTSNVRGKMFNENAVASQVTRNASSKRNAIGFPSDNF